MPSKNAPSKKKSLGYYNEVRDKKKEGTPRPKHNNMHPFLKTHGSGQHPQP